MNSNCKTCVLNLSSLEYININNIQKTILKQNRIYSSLYTNIKSSLNSNINNNNQGKKYNSYNRFMNKKKLNVFKKTGMNESANPSQGNKTKSFLITNMIKKCNNCN